MTTFTTYKIIDYNGIKYLYYLKQYKFLFLKWYEWKNIPYPNNEIKIQILCDKILKYQSIKKFIIEYPNINVYFKEEYNERKIKFKKNKYK